MKTDRELLELAAKAAGFEWDGHGHSGEGNWWTGSEYLDSWNPLTDDGDALRLAVKLEIGVMSKAKRDPHERDVSISITPYGVSQKRILERHNGDPFAATRRAIVRAAAAIGEFMNA